MRLGIGYSFDGVNPQNPTGTGKVSQVTVNGSPLTNVAGHCDDSLDANRADGSLITVGDDADPFSAILPSADGDHEKYDIKTRLADGTTQMAIRTVNPSGDDNIFLAVFAVSGEGQLTNNDVPEPVSLALFGTGLLGLAIARPAAEASSSPPIGAAPAGAALFYCAVQPPSTTSEVPVTSADASLAR